MPVRHGRMVVSPFTYYRGAALPMAADLATTRNSGLDVQLCGDAHLCNFGVFGSPERHLSFDVNDFDETAPGPWEWDVKRLAASLEVAGRDGNYSTKQRRRIVRGCVRAYRETMRELAQTSMLEVWYAHLDMDELLPRFQSMLDPRATPKVWRAITNARAHDSMQAFEKLCFMVDGEPRIVSDPPLIMPVEELIVDMAPEEIVEAAHTILRRYRATLTPERRHLLEQYRFIHLARKVVGVGSVGMDAWIALLIDRDTECAASAATEGGRSLGDRTVHPEERVREPRSAGGRRSATDAGRERHLPRLGALRVARRHARLLHPSACATGRARPTSRG